MRWKTVNSSEDWAEVMSQLAEANGCGYVEECLALKALREENARLRVVADAARALLDRFGGSANWSGWFAPYLEKLCGALVALEEARSDE